jgi:hypothetical protein
MIHEKYFFDSKELGMTPATRALLKAKAQREVPDSESSFYDSICKPRLGYIPGDCK